jgi:general secretion pathway protein D
MIVQAPKVTLFDGQTAMICDASQRPFVTDVTRVTGDEAEAYEPVVQIFWEGTKIHLAPSITPDGHRIRCRFTFASINDCMLFRPPRYPDAEGVQIQHPVVSTNSFECSIDVPEGRTFLIGGLFPCQKAIEAEQSTLSRLIGREPETITLDHVTYVAITPRTLPSEAGDP